MRRAVLVAGAFAALRAQAPRSAGKIGYLHPRTIAPDHSTWVILRAAWQRLGYVESETLLLRSADDDPKRLQALVAGLVIPQALLPRADGVIE